jgi:hypothetical protein
VYRTVERGTAKAPTRTRERPARPEELVEAVSMAIDEKMGKTTVRGLAREFGVAKMTMDRLVKDDLSLRSYKRTPRQALKPIDRQKRLERSSMLVNKLKKNQPMLSFFSLTRLHFPLEKWSLLRQVSTSPKLPKLPKTI